jgi:putative Mn2+ efflux pump MntP
MSTDAFAAAIGKGSSLHKPKLLQALRVGVIFGVIEAITPIVGWFVGQAASQFVSSWDHWIAFTLLLILGLHMIYNGVKPEDAEAETEKPQQHGFWLLAVTGFATSIDALAVGVGLAFVNVNIWLAAGLIGLATMTMVTIGVMLGRVIGSVLGKWAEIVGGVVLIIVGATILYEHLSA